MCVCVFAQGEEADDGLVSSRVVSPEELATPSAHLTSNVISGSVSRDPLNMTAEEARAELTARLQRM